ncbi:MAG: hypothetical protein WA833_03720 [Nitrosotalea sp.]
MLSLSNPDLFCTGPFAYNYYLNDDSLIVYDFSKTCSFKACKSFGSGTISLKLVS